jgi:hypothetical protein
MEPELDFDLLDDILPVLAESGHAPITCPELSSSRVRCLGPLMEYFYQTRRLPTKIPPRTDLDNSPLDRELTRVVRLGCFSGMEFSASHQAQDVELHWGPLTAQEFLSPAWVMFQRRLENAAGKAGFHRRVAKGITGAFGEMTDNAFLHSLTPSTCLAGYRWSDGCFEYVVADAGRGVLASLRSCSDYQHLSDAGDALQTALSDGESCLGREKGRGCGFHTLFTSLADLNGCLRFRSGDHVLTMDGTSPGLSLAQIAQVGIDFSGFLVSVVCRPS